MNITTDNHKDDTDTTAEDGNINNSSVQNGSIFNHTT